MSAFSWFSSFLSSALSPSPPPVSPSRQHAPSHRDNPGGLDVPSRHAAPRSDSSPSRVSAHSITNSMPSPSPQIFARDLEDWTYQDASSMPYGLPSLFQVLQGSNRSQGMFNGAHDFVMKDPVFIDQNATSESFMEKLLQQTIIGAEFDSSDRDPPPRCHPGTRLAIIQRCLDFIMRCQGEGKLRWIVGPAGVGKSAVMQMVTEKTPDGIIFASIFLSINGRANGSKAIITIAYQLAVKCGEYRQFIRDQISLDPSLLRKSLSVQFNKFIVEPFMLERLFNPSRRFLMVIDGLDECDDRLTQTKLLKSITDFCITYPTSPIVWIVASRPEPHITSFFEKPDVKLAYTKEEIGIDSDEACKEVQRYLRDELKKIQMEHPTLKHKREWPLEHEFTQLASSAGGLFAYAATVVRYIGDPHYRDPAAQLRRVLETIDASASSHVLEREHPMAQLDALYKRILSNMPDDVKMNARKLLLAYSSYGWPGMKFRIQCNILGLTEDDVYSAICHLHAVVKVPELHKADDHPLSYYHKSFEEFLFDPKRSGFPDNIKEVKQLKVSASLRIIEEVLAESNGTTSGKTIDCGLFGSVKGGCDNISLSWPGDERFKMNDEELRINLYRGTMIYMRSYFDFDRNYYGSISCFHVLTTRVTVPGNDFPFYYLRACAFDQFRLELIKLGKLKQVQLKSLDYAAICGRIEVVFTSPVGVVGKLSDPWNASCKHRRVRLDDSQHGQGWSTTFRRVVRSQEGNGGGMGTQTRINIAAHEKFRKEAPSGDLASAECDYCSRRFARQFVDNPERDVMVFVDGTRMCYVELVVGDGDDGVSEWRYRFFHSGSPICVDG